MILILLILVVLCVIGYFLYTKYYMTPERQICSMEVEMKRISKKVTGLKIKKEKWEKMKQKIYDTCVSKVKKANKDQKLLLIKKHQLTLQKLKKQL